MSVDNKNQLFNPTSPDQQTHFIIDSVISQEWTSDNGHTGHWPVEPRLPLDEIAGYFKSGVYDKSQAERLLLTAHWNAELFPTNYPNRDGLAGVSPNVEKIFAATDTTAGIKTKIDRSDLLRGKDHTKVVKSNGSPVNIRPIFATETGDPNSLTVIAVPDESNQLGWRILARRVNTDHDKDYRTGLVYKEIPVDEAGSVTFGRIDQPGQNGTSEVIAIREESGNRQTISDHVLSTISRSHFTIRPQPGSLEIVDHSTNGTRVEQVVIAERPSDQIAAIGGATTHLANQ